jgi:3-oxoadipate enol-lactonase
MVRRPSKDRALAPLCILRAMSHDASSGRTSTGLAFEIAGAGEPIVLIHAGVADRRMWDPQWAAFSAAGRVVRYDLRGYGESLPPTGPWSQHADLLGLLGELGIERAHFVAASVGAGIAVEAALAQPSIAASLVLAAPGGALYGEATDDLRNVWHEEVDALDRGDLEGAIEVNLRAWVDGPHRQPDAVDPEVRAFVGRMQRDAFELPEWDSESAPETELEPPAHARLAEVACPTLIVVGEGDQIATLEAARRLTTELPLSKLVAWPDVAHMLTLERPADFERLVLDHLAAVRMLAST